MDMYQNNVPLNRVLNMYMYIMLFWLVQIVCRDGVSAVVAVILLLHETMLKIL